MAKQGIDLQAALEKMQDAQAILMLTSCVDELPHELKDEAARTAAVASRLVSEAIDLLGGRQ